MESGAQRAQGILAQGTALGIGLKESSRLKVCSIQNTLRDRFMQQTFSLQIVWPCPPRAVPWASMRTALWASEKLAFMACIVLMSKQLTSDLRSLTSDPCLLPIWTEILWIAPSCVRNQPVGNLHFWLLSLFEKLSHHQ